MRILKIILVLKLITEPDFFNIKELTITLALEIFVFEKYPLAHCRELMSLQSCVLHWVSRHP